MRSWFHDRARRSLSLACAAILSGWLGLSPLVSAQEGPTAPTAPESTGDGAAEPTAWSGPDTSDGYDWIELTSGEWLKGDFKALYKNSLEFDSDKLDLLELDWSDVRRVVTQRAHMVRSEDRQQFAGAVYIDDRIVRITDYEGDTHEFDRAILVSVVEGTPKEINYWSFKLGAGVTVQRGNTDQTDANLSARIQRRTPASRFNVEYLGQATVIDELETANNHRVNANFDFFVSRRFFIRPLFAEYYRDRFKNIELQGILGAGAGYTLVDTKRTEWDVFGGGGYQFTRFSSVAPGEDSEARTPAFVVGSIYDTELTGWMDLYAKYNLSLVNQRSGTYTHHMQVGLEIELTNILDLDISTVWDRTQTPQERDDGTIPEQDDLRFILGLSLDF